MTFTIASRIAALAADLDEFRQRLIVAPIVELLHSLAEQRLSVHSIVR